MDVVDPEAPDLKLLWKKSGGDVRFAAMAIGRWVADPPAWAMVACYAEHEKWQRQTKTGYNKAGDGAVLDEVIRIYFRMEDRARESADYLPSSYLPPAEHAVIAAALVSIEGVTPEDEPYRARHTAVQRRLEEEARAENVCSRAVDGARETARYHRVLHEWGLENVGGPAHLHSLLHYLGKLTGDA